MGAFFDERIRNDQDLLPGVIESQNRGEKHHHGIVQLEIVFSRLRNRLNPAHGIVRDIAYCTTNERWQPGHRDRAVALGDLAHHVQQLTFALHPFTRPDNLDRVAARAEGQIRIAAQERVTGDLFAAFNALQQEGVRIFGLDLEVGEHGREQVGGDRFVHRDDVALLAVLSELFKCRYDHRLPLGASQPCAL